MCRQRSVGASVLQTEDCRGIGCAETGTLEASGLQTEVSGGNGSATEVLGASGLQTEVGGGNGSATEVLGALGLQTEVCGGITSADRGLLVALRLQT